MKIIAAGILLALSLGTAHAAVIFQEDFSGDTSGLAKTTLVNFNVLNGTNIDIGDFGALCSPGPGSCLDTQGSGGNSSGDIETKLSFALSPGFNYSLGFTINNGGAASLRIRIGTALDQTLTTPADGTYNIPFTASAQNATLRFTDLGPNDNVGIYLGNIVLAGEAVTSGVPEPSTVALMLAGVGLFAMRRLRS